MLKSKRYIIYSTKNNKNLLAIVRDLEYNVIVWKGVNMFDYISARDVASKWNISQRRVAIFCVEGRIKNAKKLGNMWLIPNTAEKPIDKRTIRYEKEKKVELKPFVKWVGGKGQLVSQLEKYIPADGERVLTKYAEPFVGGGALLFNVLSKYNFESLYIGDTNAELINAYNVVKNNVEQLIEKLKEMQLAFVPMGEEARKDYYYKARDRFNSLILSNCTEIEKASLFIFLNKTCFNGLYRVNKKGKFNVPMGAYKTPTICDENNLRNVSEALQNVTIVCADYSLCKDYIDKYTFVYLDPPYRPISATAKFTAYNADCFDDKEQIRLAKFIDEINLSGAKIMLSNSDPQNVNPQDTFFEDLYKEYTINRVEAIRAINSKWDGRGKIKELLICN